MLNARRSPDHLFILSAAPITLTLPNSTVTTPYACAVDMSVVIGCTGCAAGYPLGSSPDTALSIQYTYEHGLGTP
jgi:hypothetical protein